MHKDKISKTNILFLVPYGTSREWKNISEETKNLISKGVAFYNVQITPGKSEIVILKNIGRQT